MVGFSVDETFLCGDTAAEDPSGGSGGGIAEAEYCPYEKFSATFNRMSRVTSCKARAQRAGILHFVRDDGKVWGRRRARISREECSTLFLPDHTSMGPEHGLLRTRSRHTSWSRHLRYAGTGWWRITMPLCSSPSYGDTALCIRDKSKAHTAASSSNH